MAFTGCLSYVTYDQRGELRSAKKHFLEYGIVTLENLNDFSCV